VNVRQPKLSVAVGVVVGSLTCLGDARAVECFSSAEAVKQQHPQAWPSWTLRAAGHAGAKCWYVGERGNARQRPHRIAAAESAPHSVPGSPSRREAVAQAPLFRALTPLAAGREAQTGPLTTGTVAVSDVNETDRAIARIATASESTMQVKEVSESLAQLPPDTVATWYPSTSEPPRTTVRASSTPGLIAACGGALVVASLTTTQMPRSKEFRCPQLLRFFLRRDAPCPCPCHYIHVIVRNECSQARTQ